MDSQPTHPTNSTPQETLDALLRECEHNGASDIHLEAGQPAWMRLGGKLTPQPNPALGENAVRDIAGFLAATTLPPGTQNAEKDALGIIVRNGALDGAFSSKSGARYRFNVFKENGRFAVAMRRLDDTFRSFAELGLPEKLADFCNCSDGLFIVTGPTGSGKSTTLATLVDIVNRTRCGHIVTIEDPVEYIHKSRSCLVRQRQIGRDAVSFNNALVEALRQDPDVILVGEIRELETIRTAITAAETGHLVFTTLHAGDCAGAVERMVSVFPAGEQDGIRHQLSMVLRGVFAQHLLPRADGAGRVPACELMLATAAVANLIATGRCNQLPSAMETGLSTGMFTLDQSLCDLVCRGKISATVAMALSRSPENLLKRFAGSGNGRNGRDAIR